MRTQTFLILAGLAEQPRHGYGIVQTVAGLSEGEVKLRPGTLYGALERLTEQGLIEVDHEEAVEGRLRRYYRLTREGATALGAEIERLQRHTDAARDQLSRWPGVAIPAGGAA
ncbi:PadR family transcriptional regulator [Paractinoplanes atraurantiacus]|uniref:DNA-binding transcriptional regulator, PadR family n=1 Tax=Paractinoplanes atraurantiacus TaxID=1036182 RepID=A0A285IM25_9ACTN|nr:DNA-binding transcriptional regulator, PadR family [Actinoplanes atraurantiacus]